MPTNNTSPTFNGVVAPGLPGRLSARFEDEFFDPRASTLSDLIDVFLDGELLDEVASYDAVKGEIVRQARDANGRPIAANGTPIFETLSGFVAVYWTPAA